MFKRHKWSRPRFASHPDVPYCTVCNLEATLYNYRVGDRPFGLVVDSGEVWGSHVAIRYPRAGFWCSGKPESTEAYRI